MNKYAATVFKTVALSTLVTFGSYLSSRLWGGKPEKLEADRVLISAPGMTAADFAAANALPPQVIGAALGLRGQEELGRELDSFGLAEEDLNAGVQKALALHNEEGSKNWRKIALKFAAWFLFLGAVFVMLRRGLVKGRLRNWLYFGGVLVFGVALGADPSPMGTVKDAIVLYGAKGAVFMPRMIALAVFLLLVVAANKFICSWGCQIGVLQDLLFRFGREGKARQYKPPFVLTNAVRIIFFSGLSAAAIGWGLDIVEPLDPFKIYNPAVAGLAGWLFIGALLAAGVFIYRPWCHLFCPFGLVGWLFEKISVYNIKVDYSTCIACGACERACPSTVMGAILKRDRTVPDCFACGECQAVCPTKSVSFSAGRRRPPPAGKFGASSK